MGRRQVIGVAIGLMAVLAVTGCARPAATAQAAPPATAGPAQVVDATTEIYTQVLRRYLTNSSENSFPGRAFPTAYVLDQAYADAADPSGKQTGGTPIPAGSRQHIAAALAGTARVEFIADRATVIEAPNGCPQVKGGGILMTLGPPVGDDRRVTVQISGFVACLGGTWLTYVVQYTGGTGWQVTGTTGSMSIA